MAERFTERDREVYEAHSIEEVDGRASTSQIARRLGLSVGATRYRLIGMKRRGLLSGEAGVWDNTADWSPTAEGLAAEREARATLEGGTE